MPTLMDVARLARCSESTASRALHGSTRISQATRLRVRDAANRLGYAPNNIARSLQRGRTGTIGIVVPTLTNRNYAFSTAHITSVVDHHEYRAFVCDNNFDPELDARILKDLVARQVDGLVHVPCTQDGALRVPGIDGIPIVELGIRSNATTVDSVFIDEAAAVHETVQHLVSFGHQRIALIVGRSAFTNVHSQSDGFRSAVRGLGLDPRECPIKEGPGTVQWCRTAIADLVSGHDRPTALIVAHRASAIAALVELKAWELSVPRDMSIVGLSNEDWFEVADPPITTFEHPYREMAFMAAQLLVERLEPHADSRTTPCVMGFGGVVVERASVTTPTQREE